jgi:hypothetical protein
MITRPLKYNLGELEAAAEAWFREREETKKPLTIMGLVMALKMSSRQMLAEYAERDDEIGDLVKGYRNRVIESVEQRLFTTTPTGAIFWLKNQGWKDEYQQDVTSGGHRIEGIQYVTPVITTDVHTTTTNSETTSGV